jgi:multiple sugar transport system ATP-binding protein
MSSITYRDVGKVYPDGTEAIASVNLDVEDGEFAVFVGPSGCGKSTLLRMLAGLEEVTRGDILLGGRRVNDVVPKHRDIAMVFQSYALYPHMTVRDNIGFALKQRRVPKAEIQERVAQAARALELDELLGRKPKQLSGGQRQRVAMGRAIVREPHALLLDEPLSNLDAKLRVQMRGELGRLHKRLGTTTVFVTHDQVEAMTLGDRVAVFSKGALQQFDKPRTLYHQPANVFVAGFIGSPAMNFVDGIAVVHAEGVDIALGEARLTLRDEAMGAALRRRGGGDVTVGFRPEAVACDPRLHDGVSAGTLPAQVELVEHVEPESFVELSLLSAGIHVRSADEFVPGADVAALTDATRLVTARVRPDQAPRAGERVTLSIEAESLHFFDPTTGEAIR